MDSSLMAFNILHSFGFDWLVYILYSLRGLFSFKSLIKWPGGEGETGWGWWKGMSESCLIKPRSVYCAVGSFLDKLTGETNVGWIICSFFSMEWQVKPWWSVEYVEHSRRFNHSSSALRKEELFRIRTQVLCTKGNAWASAIRPLSRRKQKLSCLVYWIKLNKTSES